MKFDVGDTVKLAVEKSYSDGTKIPAGKKGLVQKTYPLSGSYLVSFSGYGRPRRVLESDLR